MKQDNRIYPYGLWVLALLVANAILWLALFRLGRAVRYFIYG